jgi:hypothetical protein
MRIRSRLFGVGGVGFRPRAIRRRQHQRPWSRPLEPLNRGDPTGGGWQNVQLIGSSELVRVRLRSNSAASRSPGASASACWLSRRVERWVGIGGFALQSQLLGVGGARLRPGKGVRKPVTRDFGLGPSSRSRAATRMTILLRQDRRGNALGQGTFGGPEHVTSVSCAARRELALASR